MNVSLSLMLLYLLICDASLPGIGQRGSSSNKVIATSASSVHHFNWILRIKRWITVTSLYYVFSVCTKYLYLYILATTFSKLLFFF